MDPVSSAELVANRGLVGNANQNGRRQVTLIEREVWDRLQAELGREFDPAIRRANLMVSGVSLMATRDRLLRIGTCLIDIRGETRPCRLMDESIPGLREAMKPDWGGGVFGVILEGGRITVGDEVRVEGPAREAEGAPRPAGMKTGP